jgi:hypothetical protein
MLLSFRVYRYWEKLTKKDNRREFLQIPMASRKDLWRYVKLFLVGGRALYQIGVRSIRAFYRCFNVLRGAFLIHVFRANLSSKYFVLLPREKLFQSIREISKAKTISRNRNIIQQFTRFSRRYLQFPISFRRRHFGTRLCKCKFVQSLIVYLWKGLLRRN